MKLFLSILSFIIIFLISFYYYENRQIPLKHQIEYDGVLWPRNISYTIDKVGDVSITLNEAFDVYQGSWPVGTQFKFNGNDLEKINVKGKNFHFAELKFLGPISIEVEKYPPHILHTFHIEDQMKIDGLDLVKGCQLRFRDYVPYAARCDDFGLVYFKRIIELPGSESD